MYELSKCCHESAIENDNELTQESNVHFLHIANSDKPVAVYSLDMINYNEDYVCSGCGQVCERVDFSDPDSLTDKELKMVKQWDREDREMWEDLEKSQFSN